MLREGLGLQKQHTDSIEREIQDQFPLSKPESPPKPLNPTFSRIAIAGVTILLLLGYFVTNKIRPPHVTPSPSPTISPLPPTPSPSTKSEYSPEDVGSVAAWQHILNGSGFGPLIINGRFDNDRLDPKTLAKTKKFQTKVGLPPTGKVDKKTWQEGLKYRKLAGWTEKTPPIQYEKLNN